MHSQSTAGACLRNALLCALVLLALAGCRENKTTPAGKSGKSNPSAQATAPGEYPQDALDFVLKSLRDPAREGETPALAYTWSVVAQLDKLPEAKGGAEIRAEIADDVAQFQGKPQLELVAAWLNCAPDPAVEFIRAQIDDGDWSYVAALWFQPELARRLLADKATRIVPSTGLPLPAAQSWLGLQAFWGRVQERDGELLALISNLPNVPRDSLRATGWLLRLKPEQKEWIEYLKLGMQKATPGKYAPLEGAAEGIKLSRHPALADIMVPIAASVLRTDTKFVGKLAKYKDMKEANAQQLYMAYAVTYLPGEQARLMREKLLNAKDQRIVWQARLGELLHGNPGPWDKALAADKFATNDWWVALQALDSPEPALLPTYKLMAASGDESVKLRALAQLGRFRQYADNPEVVEIITLLTKDEVPAVRTAAWYAAGKVGIGDARPVFEDGKETQEVRLAASYALLMAAQDGPPDLRGWEFVSISGNENRGEVSPRPGDPEINANDRAEQDSAPTQDGGS